MASDKFYIGLDGGGTKTHTVCTTADGTVKGESYSGCTNSNSVGKDEAINNFVEGIEGALTSANVQKENVVSVCLGMAGVHSDEEIAERKKWLEKVFGARPLKTEIVNDGVIALASGTKKLHGIVVISGTGTISVGVKDGIQYRASGWGPLLGDEGSGFTLGQQILKAVCHADDGGPQTIMTDMVLKELNLESARHLIEWAYKDVSWARFAAISPIVFTAAEQGDKIAQNILHQNVAALALNIKLVYQKGGFSGKTPIVFAGGNLIREDGNGIYSQLLKAHLQKELPHLEVIFPSVSAPIAAAWIAIEIDK